MWTSKSVFILSCQRWLSAHMEHHSDVPLLISFYSKLFNTHWEECDSENFSIIESSFPFTELTNFWIYYLQKTNVLLFHFWFISVGVRSIFDIFRKTLSNPLITLPSTPSVSTKVVYHEAVIARHATAWILVTYHSHSKSFTSHFEWHLLPPMINHKETAYWCGIVICVPVRPKRVMLDDFLKPWIQPHPID